MSLPNKDVTLALTPCGRVCHIQMIVKLKIVADEANQIVLPGSAFMAIRTVAQIVMIGITRSCMDERN
jgi:hypothetical protein